LKHTKGYHKEVRNVKEGFEIVDIEVTAFYTICDKIAEPARET
jgi:hypothetical protein